ncbi:hypothetical protein ACHAXM_010866 [Skeletonema potamos]
MLKFFTKKKKSTDAAATTSNPVPTNDVINVDEEEDKKSRIPMRFDGCAGVYNSFAGPKMKEVSLYAQYISPPSHQRWVVSSYGGLPSIVSRECTNKGILLSKNNEGLVCVSCNDLRIARGCSNPSVTLDKWYADLDRCLDRRNRQVITARDNADALLFTKKTHTAEQLMTRFRSIFETTGGISEILEHVICASSYLANSEHTPGSISPNRKAKSLVQRWVAKPIDGVVKDGAELVGIEDILIERDVIILLNVEYGTGAAATVVQRQFRVLEIYEKYYNKWFVSPAAAKKWKNEKKPFKMMVRMLKKNAVDEYSDEEMYGTGFNKDEICKNVEDKHIVGVVGKLHAVG